MRKNEARNMLEPLGIHHCEKYTQLLIVRATDLKHSFDQCLFRD
jgi:hypothetical protein